MTFEHVERQPDGQFVCRSLFVSVGGRFLSENVEAYPFVKAFSEEKLKSCVQLQRIDAAVAYFLPIHRLFLPQVSWMLCCSLPLSA